MGKISVMVVEDSAVSREMITNVLNSDPRLRVACAVPSAENALRLLPDMQIDVVSMDIGLPGMDGIEATRRIMQEHPIPIIIVASDTRKDSVGTAMEALRAGALTVVEKPRVESAKAYCALAHKICDQFVNMSQVCVVRQRFNGKAALPRPPSLSRERRDCPNNADAPPRTGTIEAIGVVASTGGPSAVAGLLQGLGCDCPAPVFVVQHMSKDFIEGYVSWLNTVCDLDISLANHMQQPRSGSVYVAPGGTHMIHRNGRLQLVGAENERGHVPSGDALLRSMASSLGPRAIGVLLTGMGDDGASGLLDMREAGACTIGQDEESCAVYGMPAAAKALGAVESELPMNAIPGHIASVLKSRGGAA